MEAQLWKGQIMTMLNREDSSLGELGGLRNQILMVLGIATLTTFVFIVAGTKSVILVLVPHTCHHTLPSSPLVSSLFRAY